MPKIDKLYMNRKYDQWRGKVLYVEDEKANNYYIHIPDMNTKKYSISTIFAEFRNSNGKSYTVECKVANEEQKIIEFQLPSLIINNDGEYQLVIGITYTSDNEKYIDRSAIQNFTIADTIDSDEEEEIFNISIDEILNELNNKGYVTQETLNKYVLKQFGKGLSTHDLTDELYEILINLKDIDEYATKIYVNETVSNLVESSPETLATLNELAKALGDDSNFATTIVTQLGEKVDKVEGKSLIDDIEILRLANVDNYNDTEIRNLIEEKAYTTDIPTNVSELTNDSGYITETYANELVSSELNNSMEEVNENFKIYEDNINKILEMIDEPPTFIKPTLNLTLDKTVIEHNIPIIITISPTFNQNDAGNVTRYVLKRDGNTLLDTTDIQSYKDTIYITHGNYVKYTATVFYDEGASKISTFGVEYPGINAGGVSASITVLAYALSYYGVIDENIVIDKTNIINLTSRFGNSKSFTTTYDMKNQRSVYMYPQSFGALNSIKDINDFEYINSYTRTTIVYNNVDYYVYILTDPIEITGFKQIFS